jgi:hypothetical protein
VEVAGQRLYKMPSSSTIRSRSPSPTPSKLPPIPGSPTYSYASTSVPVPSAFHLPLPPAPPPAHAVLSKSDLELSQSAYADLISSAKAYRLALAALSVSASNFGSSLEACARLKEARSDVVTLGNGMGNLSNSWNAKETCTADSLLAASGVHQLIANHQQILSEVVYRSFEVPLLDELDSWKRKIEEEEVTYQSSAKAMSKEIRKMEKEGMKVYKSRKRDVKRFREHLVQLTGKLDGLTGLHGSHARGLLRDCQETSGRIVECSAGLVRAEVDIFEALARKGWNGGGLDDLLEKGKDLLSNDDVPASHAPDTEIFSILPQKSILADTASAHDAAASHRRSDSLLGDGLHYQSLVGAVSSTGRDVDVSSVFSERDTSSTAGILNRSRGVRPFSPPPSDRVPDKGPLDLDASADGDGGHSSVTAVNMSSGDSGPGDEAAAWGKDKDESVTDGNTTSERGRGSSMMGYVGRNIGDDEAMSE